MQHTGGKAVYTALVWDCNRPWKTLNWFFHDIWNTGIGIATSMRIDLKNNLSPCVWEYVKSIMAALQKLFLLEIGYI